MQTSITSQDCGCVGTSGSLGNAAPALDGCSGDVESGAPKALEWLFSELDGRCLGTAGGYGAFKDAFYS